MGIALQSDSVSLASHLKSMRVDRGMTLNDLEARSGVSRATLSRIENAEASPTAETLGKLATAFSVPISRLIAPIDEVFVPLVKGEMQTVWTDAEAGFTRRVVSPRTGALSFEVIEGTLKPSARISFDSPSVAGQEHHLVLLEGRLRLTVGGEAHDLRPRDCLRYALYGATLFEAGEDGARYILCIR